MRVGNSHTKVCLVSCVDDVRNVRVIRFLNTLVEDNFNVIAIMPGVLDNSTAFKIIHYPLPSLKRSFWYNAGLLNLLQALLYRLRNSFILALRLAKIKPNIIVCKEPDSWLVSVLMRLLFGCKVIADLHEVYEDRVLAFPKLTQNLLRKVIRALMKKLSQFTDEIIHVSAERQQIYNYLHKPGIVISQYPEIKHFPKRVMCKYDISDRSYQRQITAIHAGALRYTYASEQLLEAMEIVSKLFPGMRFVVLGGVDGKLKNVFLIELLKNKGVLEIYQRVPFSEVLRQLYISDIGINLVLPVDITHTLAAPQKLYEYLAAGLPVIGANVPTIRRVLKEYECGLIVDPFSPQDIANGLLQLAQDEALRQNMGKNAREAAEKHFNWEKEKTVLKGVLKNLL